MSTTQKTFLFSSTLTAGMALLNICAVAPAMAQSPTNDDKAVIEEIIVTAQKRAESLQEVPMAIAVFTGDELRRQGILDLKSLSERTPGMFISQQRLGQAQFYIRGVGSNEEGAAGDQSVPLFIDEQYIPRKAGQVVDLFDLERVEVLRGPQGTLFGKNASGGAVHLITKKPSETPEARIEASYGNLNAVTLQAYFSGPIVGDLLGKVSVSSRKRDGYVKSVMANYPDIATTENLPNLADLNFMNINSDTIRGGLRYLAGKIWRSMSREPTRRETRPGSFSIIGRGLETEGSSTTRTRCWSPTTKITSTRRYTTIRVARRSGTGWGPSVLITACPGVQRLRRSRLSRRLSSPRTTLSPQKTWPNFD